MNIFPLVSVLLAGLVGARVFASEPNDFFARRASVETKLLRILDEATFADGAAKVGDLTSLPELNPSFVSQAFRNLLSNFDEWRTVDEPRDEVLNYLTVSILAALKKRSGIPVRLHEEIGRCVFKLLKRLSGDRLRERRLVDLMDRGSFWSPNHAGFLLEQLKHGRFDLYGGPLLALQSELSAAQKRKVRAVLVRHGPRVPEYSLLYILGLARLEEKTELVASFAHAFEATVNRVYKQYFPVGRFGEAMNSPDLSTMSEEIANSGGRRPLPGGRLSMVSQITATALGEIHSHIVRRDDPSVVLAIDEAMGRLPFSPSFFLKLTTTGFIEITPPKFAVKPVYDPRSQVIIFPRTRPAGRCEDNLK